MKPSLDIHTPKTITELLASVENCSGAVHFVAGATDWAVRNREVFASDVSVIDLSSICEMKGVRATRELICVGALETMSALAADALLQTRAACLAEAASRLGSWQIRNRATIGGNIANASPAADMPVALAALGASVALHTREGEKTLPAQAMAAEPGKSVLKSGEVVTEIRIPVRERSFSSFGKIGSRTEVSIARLNMAACVAFSANGALSHASIFVGTLGACPLRAERAEQILCEKGSVGTEACCDALSALVEETIPTRASMPYKRRAIRALGFDLLEDLKKKTAQAGYTL